MGINDKYNGFENSKKLFSINRSCFSYATFWVSSLVLIFSCRGSLKLPLGSDSLPVGFLPSMLFLYWAKPPHLGCCSLLWHQSTTSCWAFWQCLVALSRLLPLKWAPLAQFEDILYQWSCIQEMPCAGKTRMPSPPSSINTPTFLKPSANVAALLGSTDMKERQYLLETLEQNKQIHWAKVSPKVNAKG